MGAGAGVLAPLVLAGVVLVVELAESGTKPPGGSAWRGAGEREGEDAFEARRVEPRRAAGRAELGREPGMIGACGRGC